MKLPRLRCLAAGLCALLLLGAAAPVPDANDPATTLAQAKAARERGEPAQARALLERVVDDHDGAPEAVEAALQLLELLVERWTDRSASIEEALAASDELARRSRALLRSRSYRRPEAEKLRSQAYYFAAHAASPGWKWTGSIEARRERDRRCGEDFLEILADLDPGDRHVPSALFSAANCFAMAERWTEAMPLLHRLLAEHPRHANADSVVAWLARGSLAVARFEDAAAYAEQYARLHPRGHTAAELLSVAYTIRRGLGDDAQAEADRRAHEAGAPPREAAEFSRVRYALLRDDDDRIAHLERHLARHGATLELHERLADELTLARLQWRKACAVETVHGLCSRLEHRRSEFHRVPVETDRRERVRYRQGRGFPPGVRVPYQPPPQCSTWPLHARVVVGARDPALARAAQRRFQAVHDAARRALADPATGLKMRDVFAELAAGSAVGLADHRFERWLAIERPRELVFMASPSLRDHPDPDKRRLYVERVRAREVSLRRFADWLGRTDALAGALAGTYEDIAAAAPPGPAKIAALARLGQLAETRGDLLYATSLPLHSGATGAEVEDYCDLAEHRAVPLYERAALAFTRCLAASAEAGIFSELSLLCEDAQAFRDAWRWPPQDELVGAPVVSGLAEPVVVGVQLGE